MTTNSVTFEGTAYADGRASDPRALGWMEGSPPPADKLVTFESDPFEFPQRRWSLSHVREVVPTVNVRRGDGPHVSLGEPSEADMAAIDELTFTDLNGHLRRWDEALLDTYTDGIAVLHQGRLVYERYFGALSAELPHICWSVTKSYTGTLAASLVHEGVLDESKLVSYYLPELRGTGWEDATLRHVMDMRTGVAFTDNEDELCDYFDFARASGSIPRPAGYDGPLTSYDYLRTVPKKGGHGQAFDYQTVNPQVMSWVMERVTGRSYAQLLHERLWAPLGCEEDGNLVIDPAGKAMADGGLSLTLRDFARFGELMRREGEWNGKQLIPAAVVKDVRNGGDRTLFANAARRPGYSYRSYWWVTHNELGAFEGTGMYGQRLHVAPEAEMVVARFSSHPLQSPDNTITGPQLLALGRMLRS